jgi:hypothetical protein
MVEERLMSQPNATGHIFNLKNNFKNWTDRQEIATPQGESLKIETTHTADEASLVYQKMVKRK